MDVRSIERSASSRAGVAFVALLAVALVATNALLLAQNRQLKARLAAASAPAPAVGQRLHLDRLPRPAFVLYAAPGCGFCDQLAPVWAVFAEAVRDRYRPVVLLDARYEGEARAYVERLGLAGVEFAFAPTADLEREQLVSTPTALVVGPNGDVEARWVGMWSKEETRDAASFFGVDAARFEDGEGAR